MAREGAAMELKKDAGYRPCVGVMLVNRAGKVFVGRRIDNKDSGFWQMPQGGVDEGEDLAAAALRELAEETGVTGQHVTLLAQTPEPLRYDLPDELMGKLWGGKYRGQEQIWFLARFSGEETDIDLDAHEQAEFCEWKWVDAADLAGMIVPFKQHIYRRVVAEFQSLL
ncbi:RNA pyrophosphohydrolase [Alteripontixanthobacter maritimus]|uniref:RNA pyrophosphohydrolase n=1 Tax=Alteripontixanthobacter maritimus TaxID=2161824 RepID=A0A369Q5F0_9SPHN|nr:RNA pyrophosphohydrolase [Alteripontixanthobacter maritimus]RDC60121.1 RNA pyrophosphohydrolase [Alteripontixanthobacter maritimus]